VNNSPKDKGPGLGWWIIQRWLCYLHGHRDLSRTQSYGAVLASGRIRELHFCLACGSQVWTEHQPTAKEVQRTWNDLQI
jgi:hypothetical protein